MITRRIVQKTHLKRQREHLSHNATCARALVQLLFALLVAGLFLGCSGYTNAPRANAARAGTSYSKARYAKRSPVRVPVGIPKCQPLFPNNKLKVWVGEQAGEFTKENRQRAVADALANGLSALGVRVKSKSEFLTRATFMATDSKEQVNLLEDSQESIEVNVAETEIRGVKIAYCVNQHKALEARVTITVKEWNRIRRSKLGTTVIMLKCNAPDPTACSLPKLHALLKRAVVAAGLKPLSVLEPEAAMSPNSPRTMQRLGSRNDAAFILWVTMDGHNVCGQGACKQQKLFVAKTKATLTLIETGNGRSVHAWSSPDDCSYKAVLPSGMHYRFKDALTKSMNGAISGTDGCSAGALQGLSDWKTATGQ